MTQMSGSRRSDRARESDLGSDPLRSVRKRNLEIGSLGIELLFSIDKKTLVVALQRDSDRKSTSAFDKKPSKTKILFMKCLRCLE